MSAREMKCPSFHRLPASVYSMPMFMRTALCVLVVATTTAAHADPTDDFVTAQMRSQNVPGLSLAVIRDGKIVKVGEVWKPAK